MHNCESALSTKPSFWAVGSFTRAARREREESKSVGSYGLDALPVLCRVALLWCRSVEAPRALLCGKSDFSPLTETHQSYGSVLKMTKEVRSFVSWRLKMESWKL